LRATAVLGWSAPQLKSDIVWTETLPSDSEITRAMERCDEDFSGALQAFVVGKEERVAQRRRRRAERR
jgi:hypothetical protein